MVGAKRDQPFAFETTQGFAEWGNRQPESRGKAFLVYRRSRSERTFKYLGSYLDIRCFGFRQGDQGNTGRPGQQGSRMLHSFHLRATTLTSVHYGERPVLFSPKGASSD